MSKDTTLVPPNPSGLCMCGCGQKTRIAKQSLTKYGHVRGCPKMYVSGHNPRPTGVPDYVVDASGCWVWHSIRASGYGSITLKGKAYTAHRVYYERYKGPIPAGLDIDHLCRNRACVNPDHLEAVTRRENIRRGAGTKLSVQKVRCIKALLGSMRHKDIAALFGVSVVSIHAVSCGLLWSDVSADA